MFKDKTFQQGQFPMTNIHIREVTGHSPQEMIIWKSLETLFLLVNRIEKN